MLQIKTVEGIEQQLSELAAVDEEAIRSLTVPEMRTQLRLAGVNGIERGKVIVRVGSARKAELLLTLLTLREQRIAFENAIIPTPETYEALTEQVAAVEIPTTEEICEQLRELSDSKRFTRTEVDTKVDALAKKVMFALSLTFADTAKVKRFNVRCRERTSIFKSVYENIGIDYQAIADDFRVKCLIYGETDSKKKREKTEENAAAKNAEQTKVRIKPLLNWANEVIDAGWKSNRWKEITLALSFVTGRRMNEILSLDTTFALGSDGSTISYSGLSKDKNDEGKEAKDLVVLADATKVLELREKLVDSRGIEGDRSVINSRYAKDVGKTMQEVVNKLELLPDGCYYKEVSRGNGVMKKYTLDVHSLRKLYVDFCIKDESLGTWQQITEAGKKAAKLLGHQNWATSGMNYLATYQLV